MLLGDSLFVKTLTTARVLENMFQIDLAIADALSSVTSLGKRNIQLRKQKQNSTELEKARRNKIVI